MSEIKQPKTHLIADESLGGILREYVEVDRVAEEGDVVLYEKLDAYYKVNRLPQQEDDDCLTIVKAVNSSLIGETAYAGRLDYFKTLEPTDIVQIDGRRYRLVDRKAEVGEKVIVVKNDSSGFNVGFIGEVSEEIADDPAVIINGAYGHYHGDYRVLEAIVTATEGDQKSIIDLLANLAERLTKLERKVDRLGDANEQAITAVARNVETWAEEIERLKHAQTESAAVITMDAKALAKLIAEVKAE